MIGLTQRGVLITLFSRIVRGLSVAKLKIEVDIDDLYVDDEYGSTIEAELKRAIKNAISDEIERLAAKEARKHMAEWSEAVASGKLGHLKTVEGEVLIPLALEAFKR